MRASSHVSLDLVVDYDTRSCTYVLYLDGASIGRPADRLRRGCVSGAINGVPTHAIFEFMGTEVPSRHSEIKTLSQEYPEHQIRVGEATLVAETGEIYAVHLYSQFQPGPEKLIPGPMAE